VRKAKQLSTIETDKFASMVSSIGASTLVAMAQAGPEMQVKLLQALGIRSTLITDGSTPINLFNTAQGLIGGPTHGGATLTAASAGPASEHGDHA
jgi:major vault protein